MGNKKFVEECKKIVEQYHNEHTDGDMILPDDVYVVWLARSWATTKRCSRRTCRTECIMR